MGRRKMSEEERAAHTVRITDAKAELASRRKSTQMTVDDYLVFRMDENNWVWVPKEKPTNYHYFHTKISALLALRNEKISTETKKLLTQIADLVKQSTAEIVAALRLVAEKGYEEATDLGLPEATTPVVIPTQPADPPKKRGRKPGATPKAVTTVTVKTEIPKVRQPRKPRPIDNNRPVK